MALNVTGYPLEFDAVINDLTSTGITSVKENLNSLLSSSVKGFSQIETAIDTFSLKGKEGFEHLSVLMTKLTNDQEELRVAMSRTTDAEEIKKYNKELQDTVAKTKLVGDALDKMQNFKTPSDDVPKVEIQIQAYARLRRIKNEIAQMAIDGGRGTEEYEALNKEAITLQNSLRNTNKEISLAASNVAGISALKEGIRGIAGAFEAVAGAVTLFGGDSKQAEEATKVVIGAMGVINGIEEVTQLLSKNSAVNFYLEGLAHKSAAAATVEHAAAAEGLAVAEGEQVVATEGAVVAQEELNAAMLANPVGIILASLAALFGAYEIYIHTIGKATDAESTRKASVEALKQTQEKSVESIAKEESALNEYVATAKNELITREQRQTALDEAQSKFPGYLAGINLENISTAKTSELLAKQIDLIKQKALVQASGDVYQEKLKAQIAAQNELNDLIENGPTIGQSAKTFFDQILTGDKTLTPVQVKMKELNDATNEANGAFENQNKLMQDLGNAYLSDADKIKDYITRLDEAIAHGSFFAKSLAEIEKASAEMQLKIASTVKPFNQEEFDKEKSKLLENAQYRIDLDRNSFDAKRKLIQTTYDEELVRIKGIYGDTSIGLDQQKVAYGKYLSAITSLNEDFRQKQLQADVDAANASVTALTTAGMEGTNAFYNAKISAIEAASVKELDAARFNAEGTKQIYAQLNLALAQIELDRKKSQLQFQKEGIDAELQLVKQGSSEELALKLRNISIEAEKELLQLSITEDKKKEIKFKAANDAAALLKQASINQQKDIDSIDTSNLKVQLANVIAGSQEELTIKLKLIDTNANYEVLAAAESIKNEQVRVAKIAEINAQALEDRRKLQDEFNKKQIADQLEAIKGGASNKNSDLELIIQSNFSSTDDILAAKKKQIENDIAATSQEINLLDVQVVRTGDKTGEIKKQINALKIILDALGIKLSNAQNDIDNSGLDKASKAMDVLAKGFSTLAEGARGLDDNLFKIIGTLSQITSSVKVAIDGMKQFNDAKGKKDLAGEIAGAVGMTGAFFSVVGVINGLINSAYQKRIQLKQQEDAQILAVEQGEISINDEYRKRLIIQAQLNKLKIEGLKAEADALNANSQSILQDYNKILNIIQTQGKVATPEGFTADQIAAIKNFEAIGGSNSLTKAFDAATSLAGKSFDDLQKLFLEGRLDDQAKALFQTLQDLKNQGVDIDAQLLKNKQDADALFTGTTSSSILDSIVQGFAAGKRATADFADDFQTTMRQAILNSFKYQSLEKPIQDFYAQFAAASESDNTLTQSEIQQLQQQYNSIITNAGLQFDQLSKLTGIDLTAASGSSANSLSGAIKGITQQQADLLAGQVGGLRMTAFDQLSVAKSGLNMLNQIANNTSLLIPVESYLRYFKTNGIKVQ